MYYLGLSNYVQKQTNLCIPENLRQKLEEQKELMSSEFNSERASHQKMLGEYARMEQRYTNIQEEMQLVKGSNEKGTYSGSGEYLLW